MDLTDAKILDLLKLNSRITASEISKNVNLSIPAVSDRIKKLEESGIIEKYTVKLNREKMNYKLMALIFVTLEKTQYIDGFRNAVINFRPVLEFYHLAGEYDYFLKVVVEDTKTLEDFLTNSLKQIPGIQRTNTVIVLSSIKEEVNI
ncbi:transcriptional regulator [Fervidicella metallireducens AeB]|uniref:Transcriptional regulator n=1 Tax=Fervidicella metallireducens AeB TaxID=1403537 RepID=A0A017RUF8_9CLOT|nr:Lrp/AsnC family transcriptional regulator [Fervidicella metallireducens]EYE87515.1 transcriptional regulator [Fervidicella metallireducens AeB]